MRAYLQLIRPANVVTALADVLAGYAITGRQDWRGLPWLLAATACLYAGGVTLNDFFDRHLDARERPERPIPSGRVAPARAAALGFILLAVGVLLANQTTTAAALVAGAIAGLVVLYDGLAKRHAVLGPVNMGACRGANLLLGVAAVPAALALHWSLGLLAVVYIAAVTWLSRAEVTGGTERVAGISLLLLTAVLAALAVVSVRAGSQPWLPLVLTALLAWRVVPAFWAALRVPGPDPIRRAVRTGILSLVLLDAVLAAAYAGIIYVLAVLATAVLASGLAKRFAVT